MSGWQTPLPVCAELGFTVVELAVVATIAFIPTLSALIKYSSTTVKLVAKADCVRNDLHRMQILAMS